MCPTISHHSPITTSADCQAAATAMRVEWRYVVDDATAPAGCMHYGLPTGNADFEVKCGIHFNIHSIGAPSHTARVVCTVATKLEVASNNCVDWLLLSVMPVELLLQPITVVEWQVQYAESGSSIFKTFADDIHSLEGVTITGLTPGTAYQVSIILQLLNMNVSPIPMHRGQLIT